MVSDLSDSQPSSGYRVMMFRLSSNRQWDVFGIGYLQRLTPGQNPAFIITCEETDKRLMYHRISKDTEYVKQNDSIIVFYDTDLNMDLAISFQHSDACEQVWQQVQTALSCTDQNTGISPGPNCILLDDHDINVVRESDDQSPISNHQDIFISSPTLHNLDKVFEEIQSIHPSQKNDIASLLRSVSFLPTLFDTFQQAKDLEAFDALFTTFAIVKSLFFLNSVTVIEMLTGIDTIQTTIGILEYDPSLPLLSQNDPSKIDYNRYKKSLESAQFRNVIPIDNAAIVQSIQRNYYISFIRDVIFLRYLNDNVTQTLNSMVFCNVANIITPLSMDIDFQDRLFRKLSSIPLDMTLITSSDMDVIKFCNELITLAKSMPLRPDFYARLCQRGLLVHLSNILYSWQMNIPDLRYAGHRAAHVIFEILHTIVGLDPQLIRAAMLSEGSRSKFVLALVGIITNTDPNISVGIQYQASELLQTLLHTESIEFCNQKPFVECCMESHLSQMCQCIKDHGSVHNSVVTSAAVFTTLIREHGNTLAFTFKHIHWADAALRLLSEGSNMQLVLLGVRMVRAAFVQIFSSQTDLEPSPDAQDLLKSCVDIFLHNGPHRYNLLHSAVLDLIEFIRAQNIKPLVRYLADNELPRLVSVLSLPVFEELRVRAEQNCEGDDSLKNNVVMSDAKESLSYNEMQREEQYFDSITDDVNDDTDVVMDDSVQGATFIERKEMQPKVEQIDFVSSVQKRKKLKVGLRPSISIKKLVSYPIDDDEKDNELDQRRKSVAGSYENEGPDVSLDHSDVQPVQCEPVSQQS